MLGTFTNSSGVIFSDPVGDLSSGIGNPTTSSIICRNWFILYSYLFLLMRQKVIEHFYPILILMFVIFQFTKQILTCIRIVFFLARKDMFQQSALIDV